MRRVSFYLTHLKDKEGNPNPGPRPIYLFLYYQKGRRVLHPTGEYALPKHWDKKAQRVKPKAPGSDATNRQLEILKADSLDIFKRLEDKKRTAARLAGTSQEAITKEEVKHELNLLTGRVEDDKITLSAFVAARSVELSEKYKAKGTNSWRTHSNLGTHFENFLKDEYKAKRRPLPDFDSVNYRFFKKLGKYLASQRKRKNQRPGAVDSSNLAFSYVKKLLETFKSYIKYAATEMEYTSNFQFAGVDIKKVMDDIGANPKPVIEGDYLTFDEIRHLYEFDLSDWAPGYQKTRDAFVAACLHGLRISDWHKVRNKDIQVDNVKGIDFIEVRTQKLGLTAPIPLYGYILEILERHGGAIPKLGTGLVNHYLKAIAEAAGLNRPVSIGEDEAPLHRVIHSHTARYSFQTNCRVMQTPQHLIDLITTHNQKGSIADRYDRRVLMQKVEPAVMHLRKLRDRIENPGDGATIRKLA